MPPISRRVILRSQRPARKKTAIPYVQFWTVVWRWLPGGAKAANLQTIPTGPNHMRRTVTLLAVSLFAASAWAQEDKKTEDLKPADPDTGESTVEETTLGLLPQPFEKRGVKFAATYIGETLGNTSGGLKRGSVYEGRLNLAVDVDFEKLAGLRDWTFHANLFQIHGGGLSRGALLNFLDVSGIEALPATRLYEAWFERKWGPRLRYARGSSRPIRNL
jgi:porin